MKGRTQLNAPSVRSRLLTVIGTRPQFVKYGALADRLRAHFDEILVDTGQHYDNALSSDFLDEFELPRPGHVLKRGGGTASQQVSDMLRELSRVVELEKPDWILCLGDTNSTLAAGLSGMLLGLPVVHLEAGERSFRSGGGRVTPWSIPEEANRVLVDQISSLLLCASKRAARNLEHDCVSGEIVWTGDIMYDLYRQNIDRIVEESDTLNRLGLEPGGYHYATIHRAANTDDVNRLGAIFSALASLDRDVVIPLHPRTENSLRHFGLWKRVSESANLRLLQPVKYADSIALSYHARRVITDSGGVVREAYFGGVLSVMVDDTTEWIDIVDGGWCVLAGADAEAIRDGVYREPPGGERSLLGEGDAVERVITALREWMR